MRIPLDRTSALPLYRQILVFLRGEILGGGLPAGTRLPASRRLSRALGVNRVTVETAYAELEADGLVALRLGSGTYVLPIPASQAATRAEARVQPWPAWQRELQPRICKAGGVAASEGQAAAVQGDAIGFAGGNGDPGLFPVDDFRRALRTVMAREGFGALQYGEVRGYGPLRDTISHILASQGFRVRPESILVTSGSQQALALVSQVLLAPGDVVLVESPTYGGALELFRTLGHKVVGIPTDGRGMRVDLLGPLLCQHRPRLIYTIPNFHNPTGTCLDSQRRRHLLDLATRFDVPIVEDDYVGDLRYEGRAQPALKALDTTGMVVYVSTFSKMLMPGLRVGFLVADGPVLDCLVTSKRVHDLATSSLVQQALDAYVTVGRYQAHLRRSCQVYRRRRDALLEAVRKHLPAGVQFDPPQGGLFAWLRLPEGLSSDALLSVAREEGVSFTPGAEFFPDDGDGDGCLRLNFAMRLPVEIDEGIRRLGRAMGRCPGGFSSSG